MSQLQSEVQRLMSLGVAASTQETYQAGWSKFVSFCHSFNLPETLPVSVHVLCSFIAYLSIEGLAWATASTYVAGISYRHKIKGIFDSTKSFIVGKMLEGFRRDGGYRGDCRLPITVNHLAEMLRVLPFVCYSQFEVLLFRAVFLLMFFGFLRIGEVAAKSKFTLQASLLKRSDVSFAVSNNIAVAILTFHVSKNNQCGAPQTVTIQAQSAGQFCPVEALRRYLSQSKGQALFCHFDTLPLTSFQLRQMLKKVVNFCDFPCKQFFQSHSFRIGAASTATALGYSEEDIKVMGRWRSGAFKQYIRVPVLVSQ